VACGVLALAVEAFVGFEVGAPVAALAFLLVAADAFELNEVSRTREAGTSTIKRTSSTRPTRRKRLRVTLIVCEDIFFSFVPRLSRGI